RVLLRHPRRRREDLDPIDAMREVHLHRATQLLDGIESRHQVRILRVGEKSLLLEPGSNLVARSDDVRSDDGAARHQLTKPDIGVARTKYAGAAHCGHT